ncbi:MAG: peptidylprolyl isomerase [Candidatus Lernaella stagnicola]|nr:peptidylprolyl isomerase [Candidatus Lernaella stagnicola]
MRIRRFVARSLIVSLLCGACVVLGVTSATPVMAQDVDTIAKILQAEDSLQFDAFLVKVLLDKERPTLERHLAARAMAHIGNVDASPQMLKALRDESLDRALIAKYIGLLWANSPENTYHIRRPPVLAKELLAVAEKDSSPAVRAAALEAVALALPGTGYKQARDVIDGIVAGKFEGDIKPLVRAAVRVAAAEGAEFPFEPPPLITEKKNQREAVFGYALTHPDWDIVYYAAYFAGRKETTKLELTAKLKNLLKRDTEKNGNARIVSWTRAQALRALVRRGIKDVEVKAAARDLLISGSLQEKIAAAEACAVLETPEQAFDMLKKALNEAGIEQATSLHQAILTAMAKLDRPDIGRDLWKISEQNTPYSKLAQLAAAEAGAADYVVGLMPTDYAGNDENALHYVELLAAADARDKLNWLAGGASVPVRFVKSQPVRRRIVFALTYDKNGEPDGQAVKKHESWLMDQDPFVLARAVDSLGATGERDAIKKLVGIARRAEDDRESDVTMAVFDALESLAKSKDANVSAEVVLSEVARVGLDNKRLDVRRRSVGVMHRLTREIHKKQLFGVATGKSIGDYQSLARRFLEGRDAVTKMYMHTSKGTINFAVRRDLTPLSSDNFVRLSITEFYDNLVFHRVVPAFAAQSGDPQRLGWGGPGYAIREEEGMLRFAAGTIGMATSGHDTGGSQFFFTAVPTPHLDDRYTAFGLVTDDASLDVIEALVPGDRILEVRTDMADEM